MGWDRFRPRWRRRPPWAGVLATGLAVAAAAGMPQLLVPVARAYRALCERYPPLAPLTFHTPPLPLALLLSLGASALLAGGWVATDRAIRTVRFNRRLREKARPAPPRLAVAAARLGLGERLTYLEQGGAAALCFGLLRPRVAVTAGLLARLDEEALIAVLAHERHHLRRRDPLRYLVFEALAAAAFMVPVAPVLRRRSEARIELAADRAALAVVSPAALAAALWAMLGTPQPQTVGSAGLSATEARIAHLAGRPCLPEIPLRAIVASLGLAAIVAVAFVDLAASADLVKMVCPLCPDVP